MIALGESGKRWLKRVGYPVLGVVVFLFAAHHTFPYHRIEAQLAAWAGDDFEVTIGRVRPGFLPGKVVVHDLAFKSRPEREDDKPTEFLIDKIELDLGLLALVGGTTDLDLVAHVGAGKITGRIKASKTMSVIIDLRSRELPLATVPGIRSATGGVPMDGGLNATVKIRLPKGRWKEAEGLIETSCEECTIGDGIAKIRPMSTTQRNAFADEGFTLPKLRLGSIGGKIVISKGLGYFEQFEAKSPDGELYLEAEIRFDDPFGKSQVTGYMKFRSSDELRQREPKMADMEKFMEAGARRPDGLLGVRITGPVNGLKYIPSKQSPPLRGGSGDEKRPPTTAGANAPARPGIANWPNLRPGGDDGNGNGAGGATATPPAVAPPATEAGSDRVPPPVEARPTPEVPVREAEDRRIEPGEEHTPPAREEPPHDTDSDQPPRRDDVQADDAPHAPPAPVEQ